MATKTKNLTRKQLDLMGICNAFYFRGGASKPLYSGTKRDGWVKFADGYFDPEFYAERMAELVAAYPEAEAARKATNQAHVDAIRNAIGRMARALDDVDLVAASPYGMDRLRQQAENLAKQLENVAANA